MVVLLIASLAGCNYFGQYGDSITRICSSQLMAAEGANYVTVVRGQDSSRLEPGGPFDWQGFSASLEPTKRYDALVVALGTNDAATLGAVLPADWPAQLDNLVALAKSHLTAQGKLFWVNVSRLIGYPAPPGQETSGQVVDDALAAGAVRDGYTIIDWDMVSTSAPADPPVLLNDAVHPTAAGCDLYAQMVSNAVGVPPSTTTTQPSTTTTQPSTTTTAAAALVAQRRSTIPS